jgi:undecaprenyl-diphosphatase
MPDGALFVALALGLVEGLTEFIPVSSTGHLVLAGTALGYTGAMASTFEVVIQLGAILAVVILYRERLLRLWPTAGARGFSGLRGCALLALTTVPSLAVGAVTGPFIKAHLFVPTTVALALAFGAFLMLLVEWRFASEATEELDSLTWGQALTVGAFQCLALWPGVSRSASTIIGGMLSGLGRRAAVEYSFLAAIPVVVAASTYDLYQMRDALSVSDLPFFGLGFIAAFLSAIVAIKLFTYLLSRWTLAPFAWYRIGVAVLVLWVALR